MRILLIKTSSLGDIIHTLPAITDLKLAHPDCQIDWVIEEAFQAIPHWHPGIHQTIPVAIRRWRKNILQTWRSGEWSAFKKEIGSSTYDYIVDAQGLVKSALLTRYAVGKSYGYDKKSIREPIASKFYQHHISVDKQLHAIKRTQQLFAKIFGYDQPGKIDYGISPTKIKPSESINSLNVHTKNLIFFHGTTWQTKLWPEFFWIELAKLATEANYQILLPWGNTSEYDRAKRIQATCNDQVRVLPKLSLSDIAALLVKTSGVVAMDTGLLHLAAALNKPTISIYGPTNPALSGSHGDNQQHLAADFICAPCLKKTCHYQGPAIYSNNSSQIISPPCFAKNSPDTVWRKLSTMIKSL